MQSIIDWLLANKEELAVFLLALIVTLEAFVRLTPTTSDDGAIERMGAIIRKILDWLKLPNNVKKDDPK